ncbi:MAG: queuine tRNA-ribosyltransferase family protein, partial [Candidatus Woesearchaeota archaeon]|nr:queuine tRNA-ribosyltransferase family protein [Candidatus Woesearchaeota archaeon]
PCSKEEAKLSLDHTHKWMQECKELHKNKKQLLFGIAQGSFYPDLRRKSIKFIDSLDFDGIAFGGLAIGEPREKTFQMIKISSENCSQEKPRYVMGLGTPQDILRAISMGVDCFDSVFPTRTARHGNIFTHNGAVSIENSAFKHDYSRLDEDCKCKVCRNHTKSYIHHLFKTREPLGLRLASYHNLYFIQNMLSEARKAIKEDRYNKFMKDFLKRYERKKKAKTAKK